MKIKKTMLTKISLISIIPAWIIISLFEVSTFIFIEPKPVIFRAWEITYNTESKDAYRTPFKPHSIYESTSMGDALKMFHFNPKSHERKPQVFIVDEYGFRNQVGFLNEPVDAVIFGTSQVAGANETQANLVSELLTSQYNIRVYNHGLLPMQRFWENELFIKKPPQYVIVLGTEHEVQESSWIETLAENQAPNYDPIAWESLDHWTKINLPQANLTLNSFMNFNYQHISSQFKYYSVTRYLSNFLREEILNILFNREQLAAMYANPALYYDSQQDMIFFQYTEGNPTLTKKAEQDIQNAMVTLKQTRNLLRKRGITLIVVAVPSKAHLYYKYYQDIPEKQQSLTKLEQELDINKIEHIKLHKLFHEELKQPNQQPLYFNDDSHWSTRSNQIIAELLAQKIDQLSKSFSTSE